MESGTTATAEAAVQASGGVRYNELDSLRGVAALTVVFYHFRLMWFGYGRWPQRWMTVFSPITTGHEAVMLFFLLSGFVLAIPLLRGKGQPYPVYLTRRVLRIYGPYFFALVLSVAGAALWHGSLKHDPWADLTWSQPVRLNLVLAHVLMIGNYDCGQYNTAFWSLVTEMRVSIVFPLLFWIVRGLRWWIAVAGAALGMILTALVLERHPAWLLSLLTLQYGMIFVCGIVLAKNVERVGAWYRSLGPVARGGLAIASFVLYTGGPGFAKLRQWFPGQDELVVTVGAVGYMVLAMNAVPVRRVLATPVAHFLGRISYSLYLVHGTVLFALAHALGGRISVLSQFLIYLPAAILLAYGFCLWVEEPFLRISRRVGRRQAAVQGSPAMLLPARGEAAETGLTP